MTECIFRSELSPPAVVYLPHVDLPEANIDLFEPVTIVGPSDKIGALEIYFSATAGGTLKLRRTIGEKTSYETLNFNQPVTSDVPSGPQIVTITGGETIGMIYSGTGGTCYLTVADVSGDTVNKGWA